MPTNVIVIDGLSDEAAAAVNAEFESVSLRTATKRHILNDEERGWASVVVGWRPAQAALGTPNVRWIHFCSAGVDHDREALDQLPPDILISNSRGAYDIAIAEHLLAMGLALMRRVSASVRMMDSHRWGGVGAARDLHGKTVGILGLGSIGKRYAVLMSALGARVLGWKRSRIETPTQVAKIYYDEDLDEMLGRCDIVAICLPGTEHTRALLGARRLALMKPGAILLNIGRGYIVDTAALIESLRSGHCGGAGLDVTDPEPLPESSPLWQMDNVIITPHIAGSSDNGDARRREVFAANLRAFLGEEPLPGFVNRQLGY
jgi:phosphoglycerate dehydrogenase-like enzyme